MNRVWFHHSELEETRCGMWRIVRGEERKRNAEAAAELMRDVASFEAAMRRAIDEWPNSCAHNLTVEASNRLAWLGHAGCLLGVNSPEENTRCGWHMLTAEEQCRANRAAQRVLEGWSEVYVDLRQADLFMGATC